MSYSAVIAKIHTRPHPNAHSLLLGTTSGNQVIVSTATQDGELGAFFPADGQLSEEFCQQNRLLEEFGPDGKKTGGGYFPPNRRVRAINLRGEKSEGFWCPLSFLSYTGIDPMTLVEGLEFTALNGHPICNRYETPATQWAKQQSNSKKQKKLPLLQRLKFWWGQSGKPKLVFPLHYDTKNFRRSEERSIPEGATIYIIS